MRPLKYFSDRSMIDAVSGCWNWSLFVDKKGYGHFGEPNGGMNRSHRGAFMAVNGPIPSGMCVCHHCDNRRCCNPTHLFLGTNADNVADREAKGRRIAPKGSSHGGAKLDESKVAIVRLMLDLGVKQERLASLFDVRRSTISCIGRRLTWTHVEMVTP